MLCIVYFEGLGVKRPYFSIPLPYCESKSCENCQILTIFICLIGQTTKIISELWYYLDFCIANIPLNFSFADKNSKKKFILKRVNESWALLITQSLQKV